MRRLGLGLDREDLGVARVRVDSPYNSFFGRVSELSGSRIVIGTYRIPGSESYYILALSSDRSVGEYIRDVIKQDRYIRRSKIKEIRYHYSDDVLMIFGVKSKCEFLELAEDSNIVLLMPYIFYRGAREYLVLGRHTSIDEYLDRIEKYYGLVHVKLHKLSDPGDFIKSILRGSIINIIADRLTEQELRVLRAAYESGYFNYPKDSKQADIGSMLDMSKVTISIHLRKALKKILADVMKVIYYTS